MAAKDKMYVVFPGEYENSEGELFESEEEMEEYFAEQSDDDVDVSEMVVYEVGKKFRVNVTKREFELEEVD